MVSKLTSALIFPEMHDIAKQLALSWARQGPGHKIDVSNDFTRLTLDSIALCAMGYRFNSFYQAGMHPYVDAMTAMLEGMAQRNQQLPIVSRWQNIDARILAARQEMSKIAGELVQVRRNNPTDKNDLLNAMIHGTDPTTGEKMRDELIMANMNTFLIAGHETTSGLLSFAMYCLLKNPSAYKAVQEEVDLVIGKDALQARHLKELKYINAVLRETLRLYPTAPAFTLKSKSEDSHFTLGDYVVEGKPPIMVVLQKLHRDPEVYGEDAELFKPERMLDEHFDKLPPNAWKPCEFLRRSFSRSAANIGNSWERHASMHWAVLRLARSADGARHYFPALQLPPRRPKLRPPTEVQPHHQTQGPAHVRYPPRWHGCDRSRARFKCWRQRIQAQSKLGGRSNLFTKPRIWGTETQDIIRLEYWNV
jgi:Cytochrome P450